MLPGELSPRAQYRLARNVNVVPYGCPTCGKRRFLKKQYAKDYARRVHPGEHLSYFRCGDFWHYGGLDPEVLEGRRTRDGRINPDLEPPRTPPAVTAAMRAVWSATRPNLEQEAAS
jgi:predicted  nucleic acid-binding Zn-ribbon protein